MHTQTAAEPASTSFADPQRWWVLAACCTVGFAQLAEPQLWMIGLNIPASAFGTAWGQYRLLSNLGVVLFVAFQLAGGVLGDLVGRRRILLIGAVGSTLSNMLSLLAWNLPALIATRALVGMLGALAFPLTLALVRLMFVGPERTVALLLYTLAISIGTLASLLAIPLENWFGWRWALLLPIIAGLTGIILAWRYLPESRAHGGIRRVEAIALAAWTLVLLALMFGLAIAYSSGTLLNPITLTAGGVGMLGLLAIVVWVQRSPRVGRTPREDWGPRPLLSLMLLVTAILSFALSGYVLQMYQFFYTVQQYSVFVSGLALAPIVLGNLVVLRWAARVAVEWPRHVVITGGMAAMGAAMLLTALARPGLPYLILVPCIALFGIGFLLASTAWTYFFFSALPADLAGVTAGINRAAGLVGGTLAGVVLSTVVQFSGMADFQRRLDDIQLTPQQQEQALDTLNEVLQLGHAIDDTTQTPEVLVSLALLTAYRESRSAGISSAMVVAGALCLACSIVTWLRLSHAARAAPQQVLEERAADESAME